MRKYGSAGAWVQEFCDNVYKAPIKPTSRRARLRGCIGSGRCVQRKYPNGGRGKELRLPDPLAHMDERE